MDKAATGRYHDRAKRGSNLKWILAVLLAAWCAVGVFAPAAAAADTTLTVDLKGVTPSGVDTWLSLSLTGRFDVAVGGQTIGRVTANPTAEQTASGESDTIQIADGAAVEVILTPVAEDFQAGFVCEGPITAPVTQGEANRKTVFAYARRGLIRVSSVSTDGKALGAAEYAVLDATGNVALSFTTGADGTYLAAQSLPSGDYQLVQMRAPEGALLLSQPLPFTVTPYFGTEESIARVEVFNTPAPLYNGQAGTLAVAAGEFAKQGDQAVATVSVTGLCDGSNDLPLADYTLTVGPASLLNASGEALATGGGTIDSVTVTRPDGLASCAQPLDAEGKAVGKAVACPSGTPVVLTDAAGVAITYLNELGEPTVPAGFAGGEVSLALAYAPDAAAGSMPQKVRVPATVTYTYQYPGVDGISDVTAQSAISPAEALIPVPDGKVRLTTSAGVVALADGAQSISLAQLGGMPAAEPLTVAVALPEGARVKADGLQAGFTLLRTQAQDMIVFDTATWAGGDVQIPLEAGEGKALTVWVYDPQSLPATSDDPSGYLLRADAHGTQPLLDALAGRSGGQYARYDATLGDGFATGIAPAALAPLVSGSVMEQGQQPAATDAGLGALIKSAAAQVTYGAVTDASGNYTIYGAAGDTAGDLRVALPINAASATDGTVGYVDRTGLTLPQTGVGITYTKLSGLRGIAMTVSGKPLAGITLALLQGGQPVRQAETAANGAFAMEPFPAGDYTLTATLPGGMVAAFSAPEGLARRADGVYQLDGLTFAYGEAHEMPLTAMLLGTVQGVVTMANAPASGLTATLTDASGRSASMQTDASGAYGFTSLPAGNYRLSLTLPAHMTVQNGGGTLGEGTYNVEYQIGEGETRTEQITLEATGAITGRIDALGAGQSIAAASVGVQLSAATAQDGSFAFDNLVSGDYTIYAPLPEGKALAADSAWRVTERGDMIWITVTVAAGETMALPEALFVAMTGVEGVAYMDSDGDHARAEGEQLMSGVPVALQRMENGNWIDVTNAKTDEYGHYAFDSLTEGEYRVVSQAVDGLSVAAVGNAANLLGEPALGVVAGDSIRLTSGDTAIGQSDIALAQPASLRVAAYFDSNENGTRGQYERPIPGVVVEVVPSAAPEGASVAEGVTDADGMAAIAGIPAGDYVLRVSLPEGCQYTVANDGWALDRSCVGGVDGLFATSGELALAGGQRAEAGVAAIPVGSFSGRVWNDQNNNGIMDEGEPGVAGAKLTLRGINTGNTYQLETDETGMYRFGQLRDDQYNFTAEAPEGMLFARYSQTGGDARSVFTVEGTSATRQFEVVSQQDVTDKNVGLIDRATIRGIAFLDTNYNGVYDEGEPPYAGVTLEVIKNTNEKSMGKVVTGDDGRYAFDALRGGDYRLRAILPADGSIFTMVPDGATGLANRFVAREGRRENSIDSLKIANGETAETCVGVAMGGTIKGTVSLDAKYDGVRSGSDRKVSGVKVQLVDKTGFVAATDTTNAEGHYALTGIMPGTYTVRVQRREGYAFTRYRPDEEHGNHIKTLAKDGYGETEPIVVAMGQTIEGVDAGMLPSSTLTGVFFDDLNDNGLRDEGENGFTDGRVRLLSADGEIDLTEPVAVDGTYFFDGVMPGEYTLTYLLPERATMANVTEGGNTLAAQGSENVLTGFKAESGKAYTAPLVGAVTLGSFGGVAYHDQNGNGVRDEGEQALAGAVVRIARKDAGSEPAEATTGDDGSFAIEGLRPGEYGLTVSLPDGYIFSADIAESGITLPAAQSAEMPCTWATLTNRAQNMVGAVKPATIRASVWLDEDRDGSHQEGERLLSGLTYELYDEARAQVVNTQAAGDDGYAAFVDVRPGTYTVRFTIPAQAQPAGGEGTFTAQGGMMAHSGITVGEGESYEDISGGLVSYTSIGGVVALEAGGTRTAQAGVTVSLFQGDGTQPVQTAQTDAQGRYRFDGLWPDIYTVGVQLPAGMIFVRPDDPNFVAEDSAIASSENGQGLSEPIALSMAQHQLNVDVLFIQPARVGDQVWLDVNRNGLIDADEPTLSGVTVQLLQDGNVMYETVSNAWGYYEFPDVYPGTYTLAAQAYPELAITTPVPALPLITSCLTAGDGSQATSEPFAVESGTRNFSFDLGYILPEGAQMPQGIGTAPVQNWVR